MASVILGLIVLLAIIALTYGALVRAGIMGEDE